jgi:hypothetical protein
MSSTTFTAASFAAMHQAGFGRAYRGAGFDPSETSAAEFAVMHKVRLI